MSFNPDAAWKRLRSFDRLGAFRQASVPLVMQTTISDCGPACLAMTLGYHGRAISLEAAREALGGCAQGASAKQLAEAARSFGLRARGVKLEPQTLRYVPVGSIIHWEMNHFVVLESADRRGVRIVDPSSGPRRVPWKEVGDRCTGIALVIERTPAFTPQRKDSSPRRARYLRWLFAAPGYWPRVLALSALMQLAALLLPAVVGLTVDTVVPRQDGRLLQLIAAGGLVALGFQLLASQLRATLLLHLRTYMDAQMTTDLHEHLLSLPFAFFQQRSAGDLVTRLASSAQIRELLTSAVLSAVLDGGMALAYFLLLLVLAPPLAAIAAGIALAQCAIVVSHGRRNAELMSEQLVAQARLSSAQVEALAAMEPIKSMGAERRIAERWADQYVDVLNSALGCGQLNNRVATLMGALGFAGPLALLLVAAHLVLTGELSTGSMLALSSVGTALLTPIGTLLAAWVRLQTLRSYIERLEDVFDTAPESRASERRERPSVQGNIALRDVSFAYPGVGATVLRGVNLAIGAGEFVAIVGPSGSGKSTLARLLSGLYTPTAGEIRLEGVDAMLCDPAAVRSTLGMVTQDARLLAATIRDNIALFDSAVPLERIEAAARSAEIHDDIARLPLAYDTVLSDGGGSLSGGQRQRLALARALVHAPRIVVLDEATSMLDTLVETRVQNNLTALRCTRIVIAHRISTIRNADRIVVLNGGEIVDVGRHADLLARCALYRQLVYSQLGTPSRSAALRSAFSGDVTAEEDTARG